MGPAPIFTLIVFVVIQGVLSQGDFPPLLSSDCCYSKTVGGVLYNQIAGDTQEFPECTSGCVYERADSPGSPFCFKPGGDVSECKETERKVGTTSMKMSVRSDNITDWVAFKLDEDSVLNCTIGINIGLGGNVTRMDNVACQNTTEDPDLFSKRLTEDDLAHTVEYGNNYEYHTNDYFLYCVFTMYSWNCSLFLGQRNVVYVQNSLFNITEQDECQAMCNKTADCTFWSFSAMRGHEEDDDHHHGARVKRNHKGEPECGIRNYTAEKRIYILRPSEENPWEFVKDTKQRCGMKNNKTVLYGQVFVQDVHRNSSAGYCAMKAGEQPKKWKFWTFSYADDTCVLANYEPHRSIPVLNKTGPLGVTSGIVGKDLLASWGSVTDEGNVGI